MRLKKRPLSGTQIFGSHKPGVFLPAVIALTAGLFAAACSNPAIMLVDDASQAYYEWQGYDQARFAQAAADAGYKLRIEQLSDSSDLAAQIGKIHSESKPGENLILVVPPILQKESNLAAERFPDQHIVVLGELAPSAAPDGKSATNVRSLFIDRSEAFDALSGLANQYLTGQESGDKKTVSMAFVNNTGARAAELDAFRSHGSDPNYVFVHEYSKSLSGEDIRSFVRSLGEERAGLVFLFAGESNIDIIRSMNDWKGWIVTEQASYFAEKLPELAASVDVPWDLALRTLLSDDSTSNIVTVKAELKILKGFKTNP